MRVRIIDGQAHAPYPIARIRFYQHGRRCGLKLSQRAFILLELRQIARQDDADLGRIPAVLIKTDHHLAVALLLSWVFGRHDGCGFRRIAE
ncbi:hypothetical protein D3C72_1897880 [compost metagenome]